VANKLYRVLFDKIATVFYKSLFTKKSVATQKHTSTSINTKIHYMYYILFEKYIYISGLEQASPGNRHCAICIGTLSLPVECSHGPAVLVSL